MRLMFISIGCVWMSVIFIFLGAHQRNLSPRFQSYERRLIDDFHDSNPHSPGIGIAFATDPLFETSLAFVIAMVFTVGLILSRSLVRLGWWLTLFIPIAFGLGCLFGSIISIFTAIQDGILWRFVILGLGECLAAIGLASGAAVIWEERAPHVTERWNRIRRKFQSLIRPG